MEKNQLALRQHVKRTSIKTIIFKSYGNLDINIVLTFS